MVGKKSDYKIRIWEWFVPAEGFHNYSERITSSEEPAKSSLLIKYPLFSFSYYTKTNIVYKSYSLLCLIDFFNLWLPLVYAFLEINPSNLAFSNTASFSLRFLSIFTDLIALE